MSDRRRSRERRRSPSGKSRSRRSRSRDRGRTSREHTGGRRRKSRGPSPDSTGGSRHRKGSKSRKKRSKSRKKCSRSRRRRSRSRSGGGGDGRGEREGRGASADKTARGERADDVRSRARRSWDSQTKVEEPVAPPTTLATTTTTSAVVVAAPPAPRVRIQSFQEILAQVRAGVIPTAIPGAGGGLQMPARPLYEMQHLGPGYAPKAEVCPQASEEILRRARAQAARSELAGLEAARWSGLVPRGPPSLPTGVMVVEQKFVDFLVGPGGQSLASINYAAGVNVQLDQSNKFSGYTIANIYGTEAAARQAKIAIEFKVSQWLPRGTSHAGLSTTPTPPSKPLQPQQSAPGEKADSPGNTPAYNPLLGNGAAAGGARAPAAGASPEFEGSSGLL
mmetsp:Transcript_76112/g.235675  ORF Transcript_76112/g.235675 Transcript_76112/m.235675 type:complete len:392 (-) Transcript_76112:17-1192(-)